MTSSLAFLLSQSAQSRLRPKVPCVVLLYFIVAVLISVAVDGFYLPGLAPVNYCEEGYTTADTCQSKISVFVNRLDSDQSIIPYDYHHFDFCTTPQDEAPAENLGQIVFGERIHSSPYNFTFKSPQSCVTVCEKNYDLASKPDHKKLELLKRGIILGYTHHWIVDNMPVTSCITLPPEYINDGTVINSDQPSGGDIDATNKQMMDFQVCTPAFLMGCYVASDGERKYMCRLSRDQPLNEKDTAYIYNHLEFTVYYHSADKSDWGHNLNTPSRAGRIVRINVTPYSIDHSAQDGKCEHGASNKPLGILGTGLKNKKDGKMKIKYTYSVNFEPRDDIKWSSRWDYLLVSAQQTNIQWFSILNACIIVLFLSGMVGMTLMRTLHKDIIKYNQLESADDAQEEFGWKLVHGDVFRPPRYAMLLSVMLGSGVQVIIMTMVTLIFACLGFLSPANRGALMTTALLLYVTLGTPAGYVSARLYKMFGGLAWKKHVLMTAMFCPGIIFAIFFLMNLILWSNESSSAVPFSTLLALLAMWFGISTPLTFVGAYYGFRKPTIEQPVRTNQIPRQVPEQTFYTRPVPSIIMGGILPFGCIFIQLYFILTSVWAHQTYYMFGFLFLVFIILIVTCSETTILLSYFHLCAEDYRWWWRSFLTSGCTAFYFFLYAMNFYSKSLTVSGFTSMLLYFGYTLIMTFIFFLLTGTIGFFASFWFVRKIFSAIKVD